MIITNCPRCGAMNVTTTCNKCGWSQFTKSTVSTGVLLDDYKRLLFENRNLKERIAELEMKIRHNALWQASEDAEERAHLEKLVPDLKKRIAELEGENKKAFDFVKTLRTYCIYAHWDNPDTEGEFNEFDAEICKWLSEFTERMEDE